jgi:UDP-GlcNAc:undecaprenyl-phosphate GlcNAc-1-phosphate transferase
MTALIFFYFAFLLSTILVPVNIYLGRRVGIVDKPDPRKIHLVSIPRTGGVAIALSVFLPLLVAHIQSDFVLGYVCGTLCIVIFGLIDDFKNLRYYYKFLGQIIASLIFVLLSGRTLQSMGEILPGITIWTGPLAIPLTVFFLVAVTNIINLSDGLDGLAGGLSLLSLLCCGVLAALQGNFVQVVMTTSILGALIGFLRHNVHPASVFMGDTGSQFLGLSLGIILLSVTQHEFFYSPVLPLFILGTPILDTALVMYERLNQGLSPFHPDKRHLHHKLLQFGLSHEQAVTIIYIFHFLLILVGWSMRFTPDYIVLSTYLSLFGLVFAVRLSSVETQQFVKERIRSLVGVLIYLKSKSVVPWSRYHVSKFCWQTFFLLFAVFYLVLPFYTFKVHPWVGWGCPVLGLMILLLLLRSQTFPAGIVRIFFYSITLYLLIIKESSPIYIHLLNHKLELSLVLFFLITIFYFFCLLLTPENKPLNSINYLLIALAVFVAFIPIQENNEQLSLMQHVFSTSIFFGLYINLIFSRIQRNISYVLILLAFSLTVIFTQFLLG